MLEGVALLEAWEAARDALPARRAGALLAAIPAAGDARVLPTLPVGARDARLLRVRRDTWGPRMRARVRCPACGEALEMEVDADTLLAAAAAEPVPGATHELARGPLFVRFRLPTARDLEAVAELGDPEAARLALLRRCVAEAAREALPVEGAVDSSPTLATIAVEELSDGEVEAVSARMAELDPLADVAFALRCEACGADWQSSFDAAEFLWTEVDRAARRLLDEIHALATAYGWTEREVLALSPARRRSYLERVAQ